MNIATIDHLAAHRSDAPEFNSCEVGSDMLDLLP